MTMSDIIDKAKVLEEENKVLNQNLEDTEILNKTYEKRFSDLKKENAELKKEWQEQVQKATDEGYARTLQTMQLTKAKEIICEYVRLANLEKEDTVAIWQLYHKAEQFLKESE